MHLVDIFMNHRRLYSLLILLSIPLLASLLIQPIVGLIDTKMMGTRSDSVWLAGLVIGAGLFMQFVWLFAFLFQSTLSYTAQAIGRKDMNEARNILHRSLNLSFVAAIFWIIFHPIIFSLIFTFINPPLEVKEAALTYLNIRIYFIIFALMNFVYSAWLLALGKTKIILYYDIIFAVLTVLFNILFVIILDFNIQGLAYGTVLAEALSCLFTLFMLHRNHARMALLLNRAHQRILFQKDKFLQLLSTNRDAFFRTLCLLSALLLFNRLSSSFDDKNIIAANGIIFTLIMFIATFLEAFSHAASSLVGRAFGKHNKKLIHLIAKATFQLCIITAIILSMILFFNIQMIAGFLSKSETVIQTIVQYRIWFLIFPVILIIAFTYDSLFIGIGDLKTLRNGAFLGLLSFIILSQLTKIYGINGLWFAFLSSFTIRSLYAHYYFKRKVI